MKPEDLPDNIQFQSVCEIHRIVNQDEEALSITQVNTCEPDADCVVITGRSGPLLDKHFTPHVLLKVLRGGEEVLYVINHEAQMDLKAIEGHPFTTTISLLKPEYLEELSFLDKKK